MSSGEKIKLEKAMNVARRFLALIEPYTEKREIAGSVRRQCKEVGDIEIVCTEEPFNSLDNLFYKGYPGMVVNGSRLKRFKYPKDKIQVELYIAQPHDYGRILAIRTGSSAFSHIQLAIVWNRLGWCGTSAGLRRKSECERKGKIWKLKSEFNSKATKPPIFDSEVAFFDFLQIPWLPPQDRNWTSKHNEINY